MSPICAPPRHKLRTCFRWGGSALSRIEGSSPATTPKTVVCLGLATVFVTAPVQAQGKPEDYRRAEQFLHWNVASLARPFSVEPQWQDSGSRFVYLADTAGGRQFLTVDPT